MTKDTCLATSSQNKEMQTGISNTQGLPGLSQTELCAEGTDRDKP